MQSIVAEVTVTADTTDALGATDLRSMPGPGAVAIWLASTVADSRATIVLGGRALFTDQLIGKVATNAIVDETGDGPAAMVQVNGGEQLRVNLDIVSAGTIRGHARWIGELS